MLKLQGMNSRERVKVVLNGKIPDRVPLFENLFSRKLYKELIGKIPEYYNSEDVIDCACKLGLDIAVIPIGGFTGIRDDTINKSIYRNEYVDEWGIVWQKPTENISWPGYNPVRFPLTNREDWKLSLIHI